MAGQLSAAEGAILKGADTVAATRNDLDGKIKTLEGQIQGIGANWEGPAAVAFHALMQRWHQDTKKMTDALVDFEQNLRGAQADLDANEDEQQGTFSALMSRLGAI